MYISVSILCIDILFVRNAFCILLCSTLRELLGPIAFLRSSFGKHSSKMQKFFSAILYMLTPMKRHAIAFWAINICCRPVEAFYPSVEPPEKRSRDGKKKKNSLLSRNNKTFVLKTFVRNGQTIRMSVTAENHSDCKKLWYS